MLAGQQLVLLTKITISIVMLTLNCMLTASDTCFHMQLFLEIFSENVKHQLLFLIEMQIQGCKPTPKSTS